MSAPHEDGMAPQPPDGEAERSARESGFPGDSENEFGGLDDLDELGELGELSELSKLGELSELSELDELGEILRERLQQAVSGLEPLPGTLDYLRRAVPARRRRRHAALAATAVSVFAVSAGATLGARGTFDTGPAQAGGSNVGNLLTTGTNDAPGGGSGHDPATAGGQAMGTGGSAATETPSSLPSVSGSTKSALPATLPSASATGNRQAAACQSSSMTSVVATQSAVSGGITYETFVGTVKTACSVTGQPNLTVTVTGGGGSAARIPIYQADQAAAPLLPSVPADLTLGLQPGDRFEFQLAWVPSACGPNPTPTTPASSVPSSAASPTVTATSSGPTPSGATSSPSGQPTPSGTPSSSSGSSKAYSVAYAVGGSQPAQSVSFTADCGAAIYVTDYFSAGQRLAGQPVPPTALSSDGATKR